MIGVYWCHLNFYIRTTIAPMMKIPICNKARTSVQFRRLSSLMLSHQSKKTVIC